MLALTLLYFLWLLGIYYCIVSFLILVYNRIQMICSQALLVSLFLSLLSGLTTSRSEVADKCDTCRELVKKFKEVTERRMSTFRELCKHQRLFGGAFCNACNVT